MNQVISPAGTSRQKSQNILTETGRSRVVMKIAGKAYRADHTLTISAMAPGASSDLQARSPVPQKIGQG
jgi:hypothetical protein